jgi:hypothetical protein
MVTSGERNPTFSIQPLARWTAEHLVKSWISISVSDLRMRIRRSPNFSAARYLMGMSGKSLANKSSLPHRPRRTLAGSETDCFVCRFGAFWDLGGRDEK